MTKQEVEALSDKDLLVERELYGINLFGFDTYKHENEARAARLRTVLDLLDAESDRRGLSTPSGLTAAGRALDPESDARVIQLSQRNAQFQRSRCR